MSIVESTIEAEYPESDGLPMGETDLHRVWMNRILDLLRNRYLGKPVYTAANLLVYFEEGSPFRFVIPDDFVVFDFEPHWRRVFKTWEEDRVPQVVFEVTSRSTQYDDQVKKPPLYAELGIEELFLYDPSAEYLDPPLQGFRLEKGQYAPIEPDTSGGLESRQLNLLLRLDKGDLVMFDRVTGQLQLTAEEAEHYARLAAEAEKEKELRARQAAEIEKEQERQARQAAEARAAEAEARAAASAAEIERLRAELRKPESR